MLYERAKQLLAKGLSPDEVRRALLAEGFKPEDVQVILASLGFGPQPQPDPTTPQLAFTRRVMESRTLRFVVYALGAAVIGGALYVLYIVGFLFWAIGSSFAQGR